MTSDTARVSIELAVGEQTAGRVASIVAEVLKRETVAPDSDLIALGITSVDAVRIANGLQSEFGVRPELQDIYRNPTVDGLVAAIASARSGPGRSSAPIFTTPADEAAAVSSDGRERATIRLPPTADGDDPRGMRRSHRTYSSRPVAFAQIGALLDCVRRRSRDETPSYRYPSAGGRYIVRLFLHCKAGRVERLAGGVYDYDPVSHSLRLACGEEPDARIHEPFLNRAIFDEAAFSIFLTARVADLAGSYGSLARDYCLLEAGHIAQLLAAESQAVSLGTCAIGHLDFAAVRRLIGADEGVELLHSLVGGVPEERETRRARSGARFDDRVARLIDRIRDLPTSQIERLLAKTDEPLEEGG